MDRMQFHELRSQPQRNSQQQSAMLIPPSPLFLFLNRALGAKLEAGITLVIFKGAVRHKRHLVRLLRDKTWLADVRGEFLASKEELYEV